MERLDGLKTRAIATEVAALYRLTYAQPPWSETPEQLAEYGGRLVCATGRPGFTALTLREDNRIAAVCYGWPTPQEEPGDRIHDAIRHTFGSTDLIQRSFAVAELFVRPQAQGRGLGRRLLQTMVGQRPKAWLLTSSHTPAARLYRSLGWTEHRPPLPFDWYPQHALSLFTKQSEAST